MAEQFGATILKLGTQPLLLTPQNWSFPSKEVALTEVIDGDINSAILYNGTLYYAEETLSELETAANAGGGGGTSYLVYTANLTSQSGSGAPSFSVQQDTIEDIVWSRDSTGYYKGTKAGAFLAGKVWSSINGAGGVDPKVLQLVRESDDVIALYCYTDNTLNTLVDIEVSGAIIPLKIEVYP